MIADVVVSMLLLGAAGLLPALAVAGVRPIALVIAPLAGSVVAAVSAICCLVFVGGLLAWFVLWALVAAAASVTWWRTHPEAAPWKAWRGEWYWPGILSLLPVVAAAAWSIRSLRLVDIGFDARGLWLLHGAWFASGHHVARTAISNPALVFAHPNYPPLVGAAVAVGWVVTGASLGSAATLRDGQIVVGLLNACALVAIGAALIDVARTRAGRPTGAEKHVVSTGPSWAVLAVGSLVGALVCLGVAAISGPYLVNGYADPLWVLAAIGAVIFGLVLPLSRQSVAIAAVLVAVAGLTKLEGILTGEAIVALVAFRYGWGTERSIRWSTAGGRWTRALIGGIAGCLALLIWPLVAKLLHADPDDDASGHRYGTVDSRLHAAVHAMTPHLHLVPVAAIIAIVGSLFLRRARGIGTAGGLSGDIWLWVVLIWNLVAMAGTYAVGTAPIMVWLATSVDRTTLFAPALALVCIGVWIVVAVSQLLLLEPKSSDAAGKRATTLEGGSRRSRSLPGLALDAEPSDVLHHHL